MGEYRVDELARAAETSVRNVRVYQERGLLPPPRKVGRTGIYNDAHLARLRLIRMLLQRGYTFATIAELLGAWSHGRGIAELLGLEDAMAVPWSDETPEHRDEAGLAAEFGEFAPEDLRRAADLGFLEIEGDQVRVPSPRLLEAGAHLMAAGVPLPAVLDLAEELRGHLDHVARLLFRVFDRHIIQENRSSAEITESLLLLRPFAQQAVDALLAMALTAESERQLDRRARKSASTGGNVRESAVGGG